MSDVDQQYRRLIASAMRVDPATQERLGKVRAKSERLGEAIKRVRNTQPTDPPNPPSGAVPSPEELRAKLRRKRTGDRPVGMTTDAGERAMTSKQIKRIKDSMGFEF